MAVVGVFAMIKTQIKCDNKIYNAKCQTVKISDNFKDEICLYVKKISASGVVNIVYENGFFEQKDIVEQILKNNGYIVNSYEFDDKISLQEFKENCEVLVAIGGESVSKVIYGKKCLMLVCKLMENSVFHREYECILVDKKSLMESEFNVIAGCYGSIMIKLTALFDYKLSCICYRNNSSIAVMDEIEKYILEIFSKRYIYYRDYDFISDLLEAYINIGLCESMLENDEILNNYSIVCETASIVARSKRLIGEYSMLVGWFVLNTVKALTNNNHNDLFLPCDVMQDLDYISKTTGKDKLKLMQIVEKVNAVEMERLNFIEKEYNGEIKEYLNKISPSIENAMKNYRRIYYDAGLEISSSTTLDTLADAVKRSVIFVPNFSYLKTQRILGAI